MTRWDRRRATLTMAALAAAGALRAPPAQAAGATGGAAAGAGADFDALRARLAAGKTSAVEMVRAAQRRMDALDARGPCLRAVIERNPDARKLAAERDAARRAGQAPLSPIDGLPVLLKDHIATGDRMRTSAGSYALAGAPAARDAFLVARLRAAGAVILGKTNLSIWANIRSVRSTSGWSARGGQTRNPYALDRNPSGSSSGSAVAVAAGYAALAVGTETDGSIVSPASTCGIVGIKPTVGLVSRDGIVPISQSQDTAGAMASSVRGAAALLSVLAAPDERDPAAAGSAPAADYLAACHRGGLGGARLGVVRSVFGDHPGVRGCMQAAIERMRAAGATIIDPVDLVPSKSYEDAELEVLLTELRAGLERYFGAFAPDAPVHNLAELIEWDRQHETSEMPLFGQELFERAAAFGPIDGPGYRTARESCLRGSRTEGIDATLARHRLDALLAPTNDPAWLTDPVNGDSPKGGFSTPPAVAGYPHITVPAGFVDGLPIGISFVAGAFREARLFDLAYDYEQASLARRPPQFLATVAKA